MCRPLSCTILDDVIGVGLADNNVKPNTQSNFNSVFHAFPQDEMTPLQRTLAVALVTAEVHNRDVLESLISKNVDDSQNFNWQAQLRYVRICRSSDSL